MLGIAPDPGGYTSQRARIHDSKTVRRELQKKLYWHEDYNADTGVSVRRAAADKQDGVREDVKNIIKSITEHHK